MRFNARAGRFRRFRVHLSGPFRAERGFRGRQARDMPAIGFAEAVSPAVEAAYKQISLLLKKRHRALEALSPGAFFQLAFQKPRLLLHLEHDRVAKGRHETLLPARVKVVAIAPQVDQRREPFPAHKPRVSLEELAVDHVVAPGQRFAPAPRIIRETRPPLPRRKLLHRKTGHRPREQRQEADFRNQMRRVFRTSQGSSHFRISTFFHASRAKASSASSVASPFSVFARLSTCMSTQAFSPASVYRNR